MKFHRFCLLLAIILACNSCKNDLQLNAPYKEIPSIYAVLNPSEDLQMIRVNKVFLGEGDANQMAKVSDSINYAAGEITVLLERFVDGKKVNACTDSIEVLFRERMIEAQGGAFSTTQRVYVSDKKLFDDGTYRLTVKSKRTGNTFKASAPAVKAVDFRTFYPLAGIVYPYDPKTSPTAPEWIDYSAKTQVTPYEIRYTINEAYAYQLFIRFFFRETRIDGTNMDRLIDYNVGTRNLREVQNLSGITFVSHTFTGAAIFGAIANEVSKFKEPFLGRKLFRVDYYVYSASREYLDYMEYLKPSLSISQNKPLYSNFENSAALGIFTFRNTKTVAKQPNNVYINSFSDNPTTCFYKFYNVNNVVVGCK